MLAASNSGFFILCLLGGFSTSFFFFVLKLSGPKVASHFVSFLLLSSEASRDSAK